MHRRSGDGSVRPAEVRPAGGKVGLTLWVAFWSVAWIGRPEWLLFSALMILLGVARWRRRAGRTVPLREYSEDLAFNLPGALLEEQVNRERRSGRQTSSWSAGRDGERVVGAMLAGLPPGWRVLHSIPLGTRGRDIDHLVIGPGGVYSINTKNVKGVITMSGIAAQVDDVDCDYAVRSLDEALRAQQCLSRVVGRRIAVLPLIVSVRASVVPLPPARVGLFTTSELLPWLLGTRPVFSVVEVEQIYAAARLRRTWTQAG